MTVTNVNDSAGDHQSTAAGRRRRLSVAENTTAVTTVTATDADGALNALTYTLAGGADAAKFAINGASGVLTFIAAPNFEAPTDAGANNVYDVTVQVSDGTRHRHAGDRGHGDERQRQRAGDHVSNGGGATAATTSPRTRRR